MALTGAGQGKVDADAIVFGGYTPDTSVMLKDLYRAGFGGTKIAFGYSVNQKLVESVPAEVVVWGVPDRVSFRRWTRRFVYETGAWLKAQVVRGC